MQTPSSCFSLRRPSLEHAWALRMSDKGYVRSVGVPPKATCVPGHQDQSAGAAWEDHLVVGNSPTRFFMGAGGWALGRCLSLRLVSYFLSSWENINISGFFFAEINTHPLAPRVC